MKAHFKLWQAIVRLVPRFRLGKVVLIADYCGDDRIAGRVGWTIERLRMRDTVTKHKYWFYRVSVPPWEAVIWQGLLENKRPTPPKSPCHQHEK